MRYRSTFTARANWPVLCGICAYIGARSTGSIVLAVWTSLALLAMIYAFYLATVTRHRTRREIRLLEREVNDDRAALCMGRRARTVYLSLIAQDGTILACPLSQVLTDVTPEGGRLEWKHAYHVGLRYDEAGGHHDEPS